MSISMKKIIDQTDFDNITNLSKKWKKDTKQNANDSHPGTINVEKKQPTIHSNPQNGIANNRIESTHLEQKNQHIKNQHTKRNHIPQIIDEDTQHFKNRLENLLNNFKTDAISQFIGMKKSMLQYQRQCVKSQTQNYLTMYEQKHQQLLQTKQKLIQVSRTAQRQSIQIQRMVNYIDKLNERIKITRQLSRPFSIFYQNTAYQKIKKFKMAQAAKHYFNHLKFKAFKGWNNDIKAIKQQKLKQDNEKRIESQVSQILAKFQKENSLLKQKLIEATKKIEEFEESKHIIQENLKKAFLRGVCAMNMEAMSVFGDEKEQSMIETKKQNTQIFSNMSYHSDNKQKTNLILENQSIATKNATINKTTNLVILNDIKPDSKDHKWKEAPIVGVQQKRVNEQHRQSHQLKSQIVKPINQGKVIRVIDGKSTVQSKSTAKIDREIGNSRKHNH